jgi:hypothetical protein
VSLRRPQRERRLIVVVLGATLAVMACAVLGLAFVQGSSWHYYGTDRALDRQARARVEAIRDAVEARDGVSEVVTWLDGALDPGTDATAVRLYLLAAQETLKTSGDPRLVEAAEELQAVIETIRLSSFSAPTKPYPASTLEWSW